MIGGRMGVRGRRVPWWRIVTFGALCVCVYVIGMDMHNLLHDLAQMPRRPLPFSLLATFTVGHMWFMGWCVAVNWRAYKREGRRGDS